MVGIVFSLVFNLLAHADNGATLKVKITGVKSDKGFLMVSLHDQAATFPYKGEQAYQAEKSEIMNGSGEAEFLELPPGHYAVSVFADANENGKLDTNAIGVPLEGFGFSNNPTIRMGPPSYKKALIAVKGHGSQTIQIKLKYF